MGKVSFVPNEHFKVSLSCNYIVKVSFFVGRMNKVNLFNFFCLNLHIPAAFES